MDSAPCAPQQNPDETHPDFLRACEEVHTFPERLFMGARTDERATARRAVCCRLLAAGWKRKRIAALLGVHRNEVWRWSRRCPASLNIRAHKPPPGLPDNTLGRKFRRWRENLRSINPLST